MTASNIDSVLIENRQFKPSADFVAKARIKKTAFDALHKKAENNYTASGAELARAMPD